MNKKQAKDCLSELARYGYVLLSRHCKKRMHKRNVTIDDILNVLFWGTVVKVTHNHKKQNFECEITGTDIDGDELGFIAAIQEDCENIKCITVY